MHRSTPLRIACLLTITSALSIPCLNQQPGSTSCQVLDATGQAWDGLTATAGSTPIVLENRGRPIPTHAPDDLPHLTLPHMTLPPSEAHWGIFRGRNDFSTMGPYHLPAGTYQIYIQWIGNFIPGKTTLWVTPSEEDDPSLDLLDIVTCPGTRLAHPLHASRPVEFDLRITDDYGMPDGSLDRRPSRAQARWWIATQ